MIYIVADALREFTDKIEKEFILHGCGNPVYSPLFRSGIAYSRECNRAMDDYFVTWNAEQFHRNIINASLEFLQLYENWINGLKAPDLHSGASKIFHSFLLRYAKGAVKSYRIWRIDIRK